jgi:ribose/xylose/arabinose/galactoside ABC-type transport system permease subunit
LRLAGLGARLAGMFRSREVGVALVLLLLLIGLRFTSSWAIFVGSHNLENVTRQIGLLGIFSVGECLVIITAGIDLSVGSVIGLSGVVCSTLMVNNGWPLSAAFAITVLLGLALGCVHTFLISTFHVPPFVVTLGSLDVLRSAAQIISNQVPIQLQGVASAGLISALGNNSIGSENGFHVPIVFVILAIVVVVVELFMRKTAMGRHIYALGGNEEATRLSGINPSTVRLIAYMVSAGLASIAGIIYAGYINEGAPSTGSGYELDAIAAAVIGGCSLFGGQGSVIGTVIGAALLQVLLNVITLVITQNPSLWQGVIIGCVVVLAVMFNEARELIHLGGSRIFMRKLLLGRR